MALNIYNTLTRKLEPFVPLDPAGRHVSIYSCGPTVYDYGHIGNFRTFVFADLVRRYLEFRGFQVQHVMNITDVEDKIIKRVAESRLSLRQYVAQFENAFLEDMQSLGCLRPHHMPRATDHIEQIIQLVQRLISHGLAYRASDGSVYFSIEKYQATGATYGQLLRLNFDEMRPGARVQSDEYNKEAVADFALWKARVPADGEVYWPSPWGEGRPGWHIECSAMSMKYLGPSFDLHLGGEDLIFPHHEDEIAQSEGARLQEPGQRFVKYWMHAAHLLVDSKKMAKSLGNFYTVRDLVQRGFRGREIRYLLLKGHYRETFNFTVEGLDEARSALARLDECLLKLDEIATTTTGQPDPNLINQFTEVMDEDLNVSAGWGVLFEWVRELNRRMASQQLDALQAATARATWHRLDSVWGLGRQSAPTEAPQEIMELLHEREAARKSRDFKKADELRDQLKSQGWVIEDTPKGARLKPA